MSLRLTRPVHPGAVLAYADPARALAELSARCLPPEAHLRALRPRCRRLLEYGCGTGRLTLPLARAGLEIVGVDLSRAMLDRLADDLRRESPAVQARVRLVHGDLRDVTLGERFPCVLVADGTLQHLYTRDDLRAGLRRIRDHLAPGGRLRVDVELPDLARLAEPGPHAEYLPLDQLLVRTLDGDPGRLLAERQLFPGELRGLLERAGARVTRVTSVAVAPAATIRPGATTPRRLVLEAVFPPAAPR